MVYFAGRKFREFHVIEKIIHRKQKIYMVHTLFLTELRNFNPAKYTTYMLCCDSDDNSIHYKKLIKGCSVFISVKNEEFVIIIIFAFTTLSERTLD